MRESINQFQIGEFVIIDAAWLLDEESLGSATFSLADIVEEAPLVNSNATKRRNCGGRRISISCRAAKQHASFSAAFEAGMNLLRNWPGVGPAVTATITGPSQNWLLRQASARIDGMHTNAEWLHLSFTVEGNILDD